MLTKILMANVAIILLFSSVQADYIPELYCPLVPVGTKFPNLDDCHQYYTCVSPNMVHAAKCPNNQVFNKDSQSCITTPNSSCGALTNICENQNKKWVPDPNACGNWYYCDNEKIVGSGHCKEGQNLDYDKQMCRNIPCSIVDNSGGVSSLCLIMQNGQFFGDFNDCKTWYKCNGLQMKSGQCQDTIYDSASRQCVQSNGNTCGGPTTACTEKGTNISDSAVCSNYFVCTEQNSKLVWTKQSCPIGLYYDVTSQTCISRQAATPVSTCDRCEYSTRAWVNAVDPLCEKYLFCSNGVKTGESQCTKGFFDEQLQRCSAGSDLENYRKTNRACAAPPSPQPPGSDKPGTGSGGPGTGDPGTGGQGTGGAGTEGQGNGGPGTEGQGNGDPGTEGQGAGGAGTEGQGNGGAGTEGQGTEGQGTEGQGTEGQGNGGPGTEGQGTEGQGTEGQGTEGQGNGGPDT